MKSLVGMQKGRDGNSLCITPKPWWGKILLQGSWDSCKELQSSLLLLIAHPHQAIPEIPTVWCIDISDIPCPFEMGQRAHASFGCFPVYFTAWILHWAIWGSGFLDASNLKALRVHNILFMLLKNIEIRTC